MVRLKSKADIELLKISGSILAHVLRELEKKVCSGVSLLDLDKFASEIIKNAGGEPAFLGYKATSHSTPYPAVICASRNEIIVHGIPYDVSLKDGDLISLDTGIRYGKMVTDGAITLGVGQISKDAENLLKTAKNALKQGLKYCKPGYRLGDVGSAIEEEAKREGFFVVEKLTGHGVGFDLHEEPTVYNFGEKGTGGALEPGMVLAIEPMLALGTSEVKERDDGSFETKDGSLAAHFEKTIVITERGFIDLTPW
ncbi:MAG: type I methionyl aminopeptidase [Patescibacteria group bacterium]